MIVRSALMMAAIGCLWGASTSGQAATMTLLMEDFLVLDAMDSNLAAQQFNGGSVSTDGFTLTSLLNGSDGSQIAVAGSRQISDGLGVGQPGADGPNIGFTRSINNNGSNAESIDLDITATAAGGQYEYLTAISVSNFQDSIVVISGFADDPGASVTNGTISYDGAGTLTWQGPLGGGVETVSLSNPAATPIGTTLNFSNAQTNASQANSGNNQYGLRSISFEAVPEPGTALMALIGIAATTAIRLRRS